MRRCASTHLPLRGRGIRWFFSPERPVIVLKTRKGSAHQHPCSQWAPLASLLFSQRPNTTHAMYVVDTTALPEAMEKEERATPNVGPVIKRLSNVMAKLNAHEATMVAAGVSAPLAFKYVIMGEKTLGHTDRLVRRLILLCPASIHPAISTDCEGCRQESFWGGVPKASTGGAALGCIPSAGMAGMASGFHCEHDQWRVLFA
ncbi:hypothetical protein C4B63_392g12 [Trypanosoma cruzi]|uniref:Uncharacterized protein n=1 Tax=Trypanosoma cruzi TaxID=5693 RepID=A0A2V2UFV9_TRYCR|nr:hypothetical protein C4B63_392g12 [Trypanosoma cruzi]